ncbi:MAG TPA: pyruvate, water dikinase regulatory protein [Bacillales bacterium]|nr:pyruvate, water dikinase regulatory protein [Bacillales bacterium]
MDKKINHPVVYVVSDSVGETAELVVKAASSQFRDRSIDIRRIPYVEDKNTVDEIVAAAKGDEALIAFTLVIPEIKQYLIQTAQQQKVALVDILGPMMTEMERNFQQNPQYEPGLVHTLDENYFQRVEAVEFAVKYDDGRDPRGIERADIVLVGVSRTSKTPLSQYLANKRLKVANVPIVPEVEPPEELFKVPTGKCIGLRANPEKLNHIRTERLKALGLDSEANYANVKRISEELRFFDDVVNRLGCEVIDVSNKAVEETANIILHTYRKRKENGGH